MNRAQVIAIDTDATSQRVVVHVSAPMMDLEYEFHAAKPGKAWLAMVRLARSKGDRVPHRDGVAAARRIAVETMRAQQRLLDERYPLSAALRAARR